MAHAPPRDLSATASQYVTTLQAPGEPASAGGLEPEVLYQDHPQVRRESPQKNSRNYFEQLPLPQPSSPESDEFAVSRQYTCMILQQSKKMGGSECQCSADTQIRPRRAENTLVASFCGRWADLANFCSDRWFRYVLLCLFTLPAPLVCSGPRALFSVMLYCPKRSCQVTH